MFAMLRQSLRGRIVGRGGWWFGERSREEGFI